MKEILKSPLFWIGLLIRLPMLFTLGSPFLTDLFVPFLDFSAQNPFSNPYGHFPAHFFPYGSALLFLLAIPRALAFSIFGASVLGTSAWGLFLIKAPLLLMEIILLKVLLSFLEKHDQKNLLTFYWLNPILIFITYIHGQLDVVAMSFLFVSIYYLMRNRLVWSAFFLSAAILSKFHVLLCVPFFAYYIWNSNFLRTALRRLSILMGLTAGLVIAGFWPLKTAGQALYASMSSPEALRLFAAQLKFSEGHSLYIGLVILTLALGRLCLARRVSRDGLVFGAGFLLGVLLLATDPRPGWYYWVLPSLAVFYSSYRNASRLLYVSLIVTYFLYFGVLEIFPAGSTRGIDEGILSSLGQATVDFYKSFSLTLLQTSLLGSLVSLWVLALKFEIPLEKRNRPMTVGIAGDSGAGKNYLTSHLVRVFHATETLVLEGDDYHKWDRGDSMWSKYTHLNPRANHLLSLAEHTEMIQRGRGVLRQTYDHTTGKFDSARNFTPARVLFVQGLHSFYLRGMRRAFDVKAYLSPDPLIRMAWKINRDAKERGQSVDQVVKTMEIRKQDSVAHIDPQRAFADWIIEYLPVKTVTEEEILQGKLPKVYSKHILWNDVPLAPLVEALGKYSSCSVDVELVENDIDRIAFSFRGEIAADQISKIAESLFPQLRTLTRGRRHPNFSADEMGVSQLILLTLLYVESSGARF